MKKKVDLEMFLKFVNERMATRPECEGVELRSADIHFEDLRYSGEPPVTGLEDCDRAARQIITELYEEYELD